MGREEIGLSVLFEIRAGLVEGEGNLSRFALAAQGENPLKIARARALIRFAARGDPLDSAGDQIAFQMKFF